MKIAFVLALAASSFATVAFADKAPPKSKITRPMPSSEQGSSNGELLAWGNVPGWDILIDPALNNGCLVAAEFVDGSQVFIGFDMSDDSAYVTSVNPAWTEVEEDSVYPISMALDDSEYEGEGTGLFVGDVPGVQTDLDGADFFGDIMTAKTLTLSHDGGAQVSLDLTGASDAMQALIKCQDEQIANTGG